ncbi:MAG TPA: immunoglobulin domain-containing protein [Candidatus Sulfotelmatobacter sp.]|nr:immunoglobulin domain-containing protein [Candidatus Sulfotelmatobacter sp.]
MKKAGPVDLSIRLFKLVLNRSRTVSASFILCSLALLLLPAPVRAAVALKDAPVGITNSPLTSTSISQSFTVTTVGNSNVLVVILLDKSTVSTGVLPTTLAWNGLTLTRAVRAIDTASSYRESAVYYVFNPTAGTANITGTLTATPVCTYLQAYTLTGIDTNAALLTGSATSLSGSNLTFTVSSVAAGSWAAVGSVLGSKNVGLPVITGTGITSSNVFYGNDTSGDNCSFVFGSLSFLSAGSDTFQYSWTTNSSNIPTANSFVGAVFTPLLAAGSPATVAANPLNTSVYPTQTAQFAASVAGTAPITNLWKFNGTNLTDGTQGDGSVISGSGTTTLTIANVTTNEAGNYVLTTTNAFGGTNSTAGVLTVLAFNAATNFTMIAFEAAGSDWNSTGIWNDGLGGQSATLDAFEFPGSSFEVLDGAALRTPTAAAYNTFPGVKLTVDGNGVFTNVAGSASSAAGVLKLKGGTGGGSATNNFPLLVMAGGQIDNAGAASGSGGQTNVIQGALNIVSNTPIYVDSSGSTFRPIQIDAFLEGNGNIEYHDFDASLSAGLLITGNTNTYTGTWNIVQGPLIGNGTNSLGTNNITIGANAALETSYPVNNTNASLVLNGKMFLTQTDAFNSVFINGAPLAPGTYTFDVLTNSYPTNFPATFTALYGTTATAISGQITVLSTPAPIITTQPQSVTQYPGQGAAAFSVVAAGTPPLFYQWFTNGTVALSDNGNLIGSTSNVLMIPGPTAADGGSYTVIVTNSSGSVTSSMATLTVLTPGPATNFTLNFGGSPVVQGVGSDWNTSTNWNPFGQPASVSAYANPGSSNEVVVGSRLRTPAETNNAIFPDVQLTIDGGGVFENGTLTNVGELRFKNTSTVSTNHFNNLVLNGGQLDLGDNTLEDIQGQMTVTSNSTIYVDSTSLNDRGYQIDALLTGAGTLFWHEWSGGLGGTNLQITGMGNTFTGQWIVDQGALVGVGPGSLGTNNLIVGTNGLTAAVETLYDINNPNGSLILGANGEVFLHQNDTFNSVSVNGISLAHTNSFTSLNSVHPSNFPATWTAQNGSTFTAGSGQIVVVNHFPVVSNFTAGAVGGIARTLAIIGGQYAPTDADGDTLSVSAVANPSSQGGVVTTDGTNVTYTALSNFTGTDTFTYTVSDGYGGTATATVTVNVASGAGFNLLGAQLVGGQEVLGFAGIPGDQYALDWTTNLVSPVIWIPVVTNTAANDGSLNFTNASAGGIDFYRARHVP